MLARLDLVGLSGDGLVDRLPRPDGGGEEPVEAVRGIISDVRARGDDALREYAERFDGHVPDSFRVDTTAMDMALERLAPELVDALRFACDSIEAFHRTQVHAPRTHAYSGMKVEGLQVPVDRAGCYVPGGRAAYPSTVLMTAVPAKVAGVDEVCLCVPPTSTGAVADVTLAAARIAEVDEVYALGGAQAIAAMAYGTESIAPVDVVAGPGNVYVAVAKREVAGDVGVAAAFAGPSEIVVVADGTAPVSYAAIDLVVQAEHGPGGLAWLITTDHGVADAVADEVARIVSESPRRSDIEATLTEGGYAVVVKDVEDAMAVANAIAPEHLQLMVAEPESLIPLVRNAGAVFCGPFSPASIGDYVAGPSHVLPTNGTARFAGALTVQDFCKDIHVITLDQETLDRVGPAVVAIADAEGLTAHADSVRMRRSN